MQQGGRFREFLQSQFEQASTPGAKARREVFRSWGLFILIALIISAPSSVLGLTSRLLVLATVVIDLLRIRWHIAVLNLWAARIAWIGLLCTAVGFSLAEYDIVPLVLIPVVILLAIAYVQYSYLKWKISEEQAISKSERAEGQSSR
jgi:hypothetical protein